MRKPNSKHAEIIPKLEDLDAYTRSGWDWNVFFCQRCTFVGDTFRLYWYQPKLFQTLVDRLKDEDTLNDTSFTGQLISAILGDNTEKDLKRLNPDYAIIWKNVKKDFEKSKK